MITVLSAIAIQAQSIPCEKLLLSYDSFQAKPDQKWQLKIKDEERYVLYYFGAEHSKDSGHQQFADIKKYWTEVKPDIALFEGPDRGILPGEGETIAKLGESGYVRFLAKQNNAPVRTLEARPDAEIEYLLKSFPIDQIKLFYVLREAQRVREQLKMNKEEIYKHIASLLVRVRQLPDMQDTTFTVASMEPAFAKYWGNKSEWWQAPSAWFDPLKTSGETGGIFTNDINKKLSEFRNVYMFRLISGLLKEGKKVFAVVGRNHVPMQAQALECEWKNFRRH